MGAVSCYLKFRNEARIEAQIREPDHVMAEIVVGDQRDDDNQSQSQDSALIDEDNQSQSQDLAPSSPQIDEWVSFGDEDLVGNQVLPNPDPSSLSRSNSSLASRSVSKQYQV